MTQKLLFADDSLTMHRVVAITFGQQDIALTGAHSGAQALALQAQNSYDVALIDAQLGDMDGYTLCQKLQEGRGHNSPLPVLILVSAQHPVDNNALLACGAAGTVTKPFDTQTLIAKVKEACLRGASTPHAGKTLAQPPPTRPSPPLAGHSPQSSQQPAEAVSRPAFFQAPPPVPMQNKAQEPWTLGSGVPDLSHAPKAADMPQEHDLPQMPQWSIDAPLPRDIPKDTPLWSEKESTTAEDLRRPNIDADVTAIARADARKEEGAPTQALGSPAVRPVLAAVQQAVGQLPKASQAALGPEFVDALAQGLAHALERAIWDVLPAIAREETRSYLRQHPPA